MHTPDPAIEAFPAEVRIPVADLPRIRKGTHDPERLVCAALTQAMMTASEVAAFPVAVGVCAHDQRMILEACWTNTQGCSEWDCRSQHYMCYLASRQDDDVVIRRLSRDERPEMGPVIWEGDGHAGSVLYAWARLVGDDETLGTEPKGPQWGRWY